MDTKSQHSISSKAADKHMTIGELEAFVRQARALGAGDNDVPKFKFNAWAESIKSATLEFDAPSPSEIHPL